MIFFRNFLLASVPFAWMVTLYLVKYFGVSPILDDVLFVMGVAFAFYEGKIENWAISSSALILSAILFSFLASGDGLSVRFAYAIRDYLVPFTAIFFGYWTGQYVSFESFRRYIILLIPVLVVSLIVGIVLPESMLAITDYSDNGPPSLRVGLFFTNPNTFAYYICLISIVVLAKEELDISDFACVVILGVLLLFTTSRSGMMIFLALMLARFFSCFFIRPFFASSILTLLLLLSSLILEVFSSHFDNLRLTRYASLERIFMFGERLSIWSGHLKDQLNIWKILFGEGASVLSRPDGYNSWVVFDSVFLKYFLEIGLFGIFSYIIIFCGIWSEIRVQGKRGAHKMFFFMRMDRLSYCFLSICTLIIASGVVSTIFDVYPVNYMVYYFVGFIWFHSKKNA